MTDKQEVIINNINLDDVKKLLYTGQRTAITTATFEKIIELLEEKTAECEELKKEKQDYCLNCDVAERILLSCNTILKEDYLIGIHYLFKDTI